MLPFNGLHQSTLDKLYLEFRIGICEALLKNHPDSIDILMELGNLYTSCGRYEDGLKIDLRLVSLLPSNPVVHYNLACSYSLLERKEEAFSALEKALDLGFSDFTLLLKDKDLNNIRSDPRFRPLLTRCQKNKQKQKSL
jgi:tetratricopeptide (TPR) repeat protein